MVGACAAGGGVGVGVLSWLCAYTIAAARRTEGLQQLDCCCDEPVHSREQLHASERGRFRALAWPPPPSFTFDSTSLMSRPDRVVPMLASHWSLDLAVLSNRLYSGTNDSFSTVCTVDFAAMWPDLVLRSLFCC